MVNSLPVQLLPPSSSNPATTSMPSIRCIRVETDPPPTIVLVTVGTRGGSKGRGMLQRSFRTGLAAANGMCQDPLRVMKKGPLRFKPDDDSSNDPTGSFLRRTCRTREHTLPPLRFVQVRTIIYRGGSSPLHGRALVRRSPQRIFDPDPDP